MNRVKNSFTLIELLIVVAIIGILAGVGIPMYNGYMENAKINACQSNHQQMIKSLSSNLAKCELGTLDLAFKNKDGVPMEVLCSGSTWTLTGQFSEYFKGIFKNPWGKVNNTWDFSGIFEAIPTSCKAHQHGYSYIYSIISHPNAGLKGWGNPGYFQIGSCCEVGVAPIYNIVNRSM